MSEEKPPRNAIIIAANLSMSLPQDQQDFRNDLAEFIRDCAYTSPELCTEPAIWKKLENVMKKHIVEIDADWKQTLVDLYVGKTEFQNL
jgi:hypothetical protein